MAAEEERNEEGSLARDGAACRMEEDTAAESFDEPARSGGSGSGMGADAAAVVVVAGRAAVRETPKTAMAWALPHAVQHGDTILLLVLNTPPSTGTASDCFSVILFVRSVFRRVPSCSTFAYLDDSLPEYDLPPCLYVIGIVRGISELLYVRLPRQGVDSHKRTLHLVDLEQWPLV